MSNIVNLDNEQSSFLGTASFYRCPDGTVSVMVTEMAPWLIEQEPTVKARFDLFAGWLREGADDLVAQGSEFEETDPTNEPLENKS